MTTPIDYTALVGRLFDQGFNYSANPLYDEAGTAITELVEALRVAQADAENWKKQWTHVSELAANAQAKLDALEKLKDPAILHANLLRGVPAKLSKEQLLHLLGTDAQPVATPVNQMLLEAADSLLRHVIDKGIDRRSTCLPQDVSNLRAALTAAQETATKDGCEICHGAKGGVPGNENVIDGKRVCDYCHAAPEQRGDSVCSCVSSMCCDGASNCKYSALRAARGAQQPLELSDDEIWKFWCTRPEILEGEDDSMEAEFVAACRRLLAAANERRAG